MHEVLMQASSGMTQIRDLRRLLNLIVHFIPKVMKLKNASIYLFDRELNQFVLKATRYRNQNIPQTIDIDDPLIKCIKIKKSPLVYEEVRFQFIKDRFLSEVAKRLKDLSCALILPCFVEENLLGFLALGEKKSNRIFTKDDLDVLITLTNQSSLAIENALFYERDKENQALLYQSATLADMGVMADSMGHQIKNHIQKMMMEAGVSAAILEDFISKNIDTNKAIELLKRAIETLHNIENQGEIGGKLIESVNKFSRLPKADFREITLKEIIETANSILRFKIRFDEIDYKIDIPQDLDILYAHPILSEAFVNLIDNAYDAIVEKQNSLLEPDRNSYRGSISISAKKINDYIEIIVEDNGIGIKKENLQHLFLPFYTTKATSQKGTGLGLFVIKKIISNHKGTIKLESIYMQGTKFIITLPIRQKGG